jgi:hypothetical protein
MNAQPISGCSGPQKHHIYSLLTSQMDSLWEKSAQTILQGYNAMLVKDKKRDFIPYGFHVVFYLVKDIAQAKQEGPRQLEFRFATV